MKIQKKAAFIALTWLNIAAAKVHFIDGEVLVNDPERINQISEEYECDEEMKGFLNELLQIRKVKLRKNRVIINTETQSISLRLTSDLRTVLGMGTSQLNSIKSCDEEMHFELSSFPLDQQGMTRILEVEEYEIPEGPPSKSLTLSEIKLGT